MHSSTQGAASDSGFTRPRLEAVLGGPRVVLDKALKRDAGKRLAKERQSCDAAIRSLRGASKRDDRQVLSPAALLDDELNLDADQLDAVEGQLRRDGVCAGDSPRSRSARSRLCRAFAMPGASLTASDRCFTASGSLPLLASSVPTS